MPYHLLYSGRSLYRPIQIYVVLLVCLVTSAHAAVYVDYGAPGPVHNGTSWVTAYTSIGQALQSLGNGGEVWVKTGAYRECLTLNTYTTIYGGFLGFETSADQRLAGAFPTVISGECSGRVIAMPTSARVTLDGLTIRDGKADRGAGIRCSTNSTVNIRNCRILSCEATVRGGGVYYDTYTLGSMENCLVEYNKAPNGAGVVVEYHSYPTLHGCVVVRNHATASGGGVYCPFHSGALLTNCTVAYNQADTNGGGIYAYYGGPETFISCIIAFNTAPAGGGLFADGGRSSATLSNCDWYGNSIGNLGGWLTSLPAGNITSDPVFLMPAADEFHLQVGSPCAGMGAFALDSVYAITRIGVGKMLPDGASIGLANKIVSCVDGPTVYLQEPDRASAIAVLGLTGCSPGQILSSVTGSLSTSGTARVLNATSAATCAGVTFTPRPLGVALSCLTATPGMFAVTWGRVTALTPNGFVLTDGHASINVRSSGPEPQVGSYVTVTGTLTLDGTFLARAIQVVKASH